MILFLKQSFWTSIISNASSLIALIGTAFLARYISPETFGIYVLLIATREIISVICSPSLSQTYLFSNGKLGDFKIVCKINVIFSFLIILVTFIVAYFIDIYYENNHFNFIILFGFLSALNNYSSIFFSIGEKQMNFKKTSLFRSLALSFSFIATCILAFYMGDNVEVLIYKEIIFTFLLFILSVTFYKNLIKDDVYNKNTNFTFLLGYSKRSYFSRLTEIFTYRIFEIMTANFLGKNILGLFNQVLGLARIPYKFLGSITENILFVHLKNNIKKNRQEDFCLIQNLILFFTIPIILFFNLFNDVLIDIILGSKWHEASKLIGLISTFSLILPFHNGLITVYQASDNQRYYTFSNLIVLITQIVGIILFEKNIEIFIIWFCISFLLSTIFLTIKINYNDGFATKKIIKFLIIIILISFATIAYHFNKSNYILCVPILLWIYILYKIRNIFMNFIIKWKNF